jgi:hypothetical protein
VNVTVVNKDGAVRVVGFYLKATSMRDGGSLEAPDIKPHRCVSYEVPSRLSRFSSQTGTIIASSALPTIYESTLETLRQRKIPVKKRSK